MALQQVSRPLPLPLFIYIRHFFGNIPVVTLFVNAVAVPMAARTNSSNFKYMYVLCGTNKQEQDARHSQNTRQHRPYFEVETSAAP